MVRVLAADLIAIITRASSVSGVQDALCSEIDGLQELKIQIYDRDTNICLDTGNLALEGGCTIILKELQSLGVAHGKQQEPRLTITSSNIARSNAKGSACLSPPRCDIAIPLIQPRPSEAPCHFGSLVAKVKCSYTGRPSTQSVHGAVKLAEAISIHHSQQLCEFISIVTSVLFRPMDLMNPPPPPLSTRRARRPPPPESVNFPQQEQNDRSTTLFSTALAPLASHGVQLPGPLPKVNLLTLEFKNRNFEADFHTWKAECMRNQDLWSLCACLVVIIASVPMTTTASQVLHVVVILAAAAVTAMLATNMQSSPLNNKTLTFYRNNRDKILLASTLCIATGVNLTGGSLALKNQIFALVAVLLPVRLRWHIAQLFVALGCRLGSLVVSSTATSLDVVRLFIGVVLAPFTLAYVVEAVARRGFLSRQALAAAAAAAAAEYDDDYDYDDDEEDFDVYAEDDDEDWLYDDQDPNSDDNV